MQKRFDKLKQTLTSFRRDEFNKAARAAMSDTQDSPSPSDVPKERTTLKLDKSHGIVSPSQSAHSQAPPPPADAPSTPEPSHKHPVQPAHPSPPQTPSQTEPDLPQSDVSSQPAKSESSETVEPSHGQHTPSSQVQDAPLPTPDQSQAPRDERSAALHARTPRSRRKPSADDSMVQVNFKIDRTHYHAFKKKCEDEGKNLSKVFRNLIKAYIGLCLILSSALISPNPSSSLPLLPNTRNHHFTPIPGVTP